MNDIQQATYLSIGDGLADQVKNGKKSDSQAKADLAAEFAKTESAARGDQEDSAPHLCNRGGGLLVCNN